MKRYEICETIGRYMINIGVILVLITMCIDLDYSKDSWKYMLIGFGISVFTIAIGYMLVYLYAVEAILLSAFIVTCAFTYSIIKVPIDFMHTCYKLHRRYGKYRYTFKILIYSYDRYINSKCKEDVCE